METELTGIFTKRKASALPKGWQWKRLKEVGKIGSGNTPSKEIDNFWIGGNVPWLPTGKVNDRVIVKSETFITQEAVKKNTIKLLPVGTVLVAMIGQGQTRGRAALLNIEAWVNQNFAYVIPKDTVLPTFLFTILEFQYEKIRYEGDRGGNQGSLNGDMVKNIKIPLPPLPQQRKIAAILSTWDEAIQIADQLLKAKQERKRGLMQQLLTGQKRLPGFSGEWREVKLGEICSRLTRRNVEGNTNVLTISAQLGLISQRDFFNKSVASEEVKNYFLLKRGEFAYNKSYSAGYPYGAVKRLDYYEKGILSPLYICLGVPNGDSDFFAHFFEFGALNHGIYRIAQEGARNHGLLNISAHDFFQMPLQIPELEEQQAISAILTTAIEEIRLATTGVEALKRQKRGLMQQLLTGQKLVTVDE